MTALPPNLAKWGSPLSELAPELALALGPWLERLWLAIGPIPRPSALGEGQPDGFDGLLRRGSYERLLLTEWLLAGELPEEFDRRAVSGEHTFLAPRRVQQAGGRRVVALFNSGPRQLGTPRLAHLALMIVLARRAQEAAAEFAWSCVDGETLAVSEGGKKEVQRLLTQAAAFEPDEAKQAHWDRELGERHASEERWVIGAPGMRIAGAHHVDVLDVLEPGGRKLEVRVKPLDQARRGLELELPGDADCVRLLRNPFPEARAAPSAKTTPIGKDSGICFSADGRRLFAWRSKSEIVGFHVPASKSDAVGALRRFVVPDGTELIAVGMARKRGLAATLCGREVTIWNIDRRGEAGSHITRFMIGSNEWETPATAREGMRVPQLFWHWQYGYLIDAEGTLFCFSADGKFEPLDFGVSAHAARDGTLRYVTNERKFSSVSRDGKGKFDVSMVGAVPGEGTLEAHHGSSERGAGFGSFAARITAGEWAVYSALLSGEERLFPPAEAEVVGTALSKGRPGLLILEPDRRTVSFVGRHDAYSLPAAPEDVRSVSVCTARPLICCETADELLVYNLAQRELLLHIPVDRVS